MSLSNLLSIKYFYHLRTLCPKKECAFLEQLVSFLAGNIGNLFSSKSISDFLKSQKVDISPYVVSEYAMALSDAFIVHRVGRYDIAGKK